MRHLFIYFVSCVTNSFFFVVLGFEFRASCLLDRRFNHLNHTSSPIHSFLLLSSIPVCGYNTISLTDLRLKKRMSCFQFGCLLKKAALNIGTYVLHGHMTSSRLNI
jgi:hypothetical protein